MIFRRHHPQGMSWDWETPWYSMWLMCDSFGKVKRPPGGGPWRSAEGAALAARIGGAVAAIRRAGGRHLEDHGLLLGEQLGAVGLHLGDGLVGGSDEAVGVVRHA